MDILAIITEFFRSTYGFAHSVVVVVAIVLLVSGMDDLWLDMYYWYHRIFRKEKIEGHRREDPERLREEPEKSIALFVPAWHEEEVIDKMLLNACQTLNYSNYEIFVGVYPNDPGTLRKVNMVRAQYPHVHAIIAGHDGPSTKADNLNDLLQGMIQYENKKGKRFEIIVGHDAEDVIHPESLRVHNYFIPKYDMVQIPVFPLPVPNSKIVGWTYADEFAENHTKDLVTRQLYSRFIPSAGVGTGYNRWLIEFAGTSFARNIFRKSSLTEDYDMALRLAIGEARQLYAYLPFDMDICTRAYFPDQIWTAIRQKTRWMIGICLQSWKNVGWTGDLKFRFTLYRDRKAVVTNIVNAVAYFVSLYILTYEIARRGWSGEELLPPIVSTADPIWPMIIVNTVLMFWRFFQRAVSVGKIYGRAQGFYSILRYPVSNMINSYATGRGIIQFALAAHQKRKLQWDKTTHTFPAVDDMPAVPTAGPTGKEIPVGATQTRPAQAQGGGKKSAPGETQGIIISRRRPGKREQTPLSSNPSAAA
jgi:adsorption protein B